ncbi:peptidoglycan DD-metalloendopeptidase family protein [Marivibrio halodurans]
MGSSSKDTEDVETKGGRAKGVRENLQDRLRWIFRERELLIRSEDRVRYLRLRPWMQGSLVGMVSALGLWAAVGTGVSYWQQTNLDKQDAEIVEAKLAYDRVRADLETYRVRVGVLARGIFARQREIEADEGHGPVSGVETDEALAVDLEELAEISTRIEGAFDRIATDLDVTEADRQRIVQSRDALHSRIQELESALADARDQGRQLTGQVGRLIQERDRALTAQEAADRASADLARTLRDVRGELAATDRRERALRGRMATLSDALDSTKEAVETVEAERDSLNERLAAVRDDLSESRSARRAAERRIEHVVRDLASISGLSVDREGDALAALESESRSVVSDLHKARRRADAAESTLSEVVMSLARLAKDSGAVRTASGGAAGDMADASPEGDKSDLIGLLASITPQSGGVHADTSSAWRGTGDIGDPVGHAEALLSEIEGLHDSQRTLVERLSEETEKNLHNTEALLKLAGLDVDAMLRRVGFEGGKGGPMLEASVEALPAALPETYAEDVELLETRINRWRALQQVVRCVPLISPIDNYHVTSPFGKRKDPFNNRWAIHEGVDLGGWPGISIMAAAPGTVVRAGRDGGYGNKVVIDHGCGIRTVYAHMKSIAVKKGQRVEHRETIGKLGSTGRSTGPHVHYEVQVDGEPLDPEQFIEAGKHVFKI